MTNIWTKGTLEDICFYVSQKIKTCDLTKENYLSTENMLPEKQGIVDATCLPTLAYSHAFLQNDILISNIRPYFKKIWFARFNGGCSNDVLVFRAKDGIDPRFLYYVLSNNKFFDYATTTAKGTKMPRGDRTAILQYPITFPSDIDIQKKIAGVLSALDNKIELNNQINSNLEQQAQALLAKHNESINTKCPLGTVLNFANGFAFKSTDYLPNGKYKIITIKNVQDGKVDSQGASCINKIPEKLSETCILRIGDILLSLTGNVGRVGIVCEQNLLLNQRVAKILPKKPNLHAFLYFVLRQPAFKTEMENISKGTAQQNLSPIEMLNLNITYSETETNKISSTLDSYFDDIICNTIEIYNLNKIRDSLLPKLMSGEIDVSKIDISDLI